MELLGLILIFILSPLEIFFMAGDAGTISKYLGFLILIIFFLRVLNNNKVFLPREGYLLLAFIVLGMGSSLWASYPSASITRSATLIQLFGLYIITYNILKNNESRLARNLFNIIIIFSVGISLYAIFQTINLGSINQWTRVSISNDVDVNHLASFLIPSLLLSLHYAFTKPSKYLLPTILIATAVFLTQSRGAIVAIMIALGFYFLMTVNKKNIKFKHIFLTILIMGFVFTVIPEEFLFRIEQMFTDRTVLMRGSGRNVIWGWAWQEFTNKPIAGIGLGNFSVIYRPPHSSLFQIISELGLLGFSLISLFVVSLLKYKNNLEDKGIKIEQIVVIALLAMSLTVDIFYQKYLWIMMGIWSAKKASVSNQNDGAKAVSSIK